MRKVGLIIVSVTMLLANRSLAIEPVSIAATATMISSLALPYIKQAMEQISEWRNPGCSDKCYEGSKHCAGQARITSSNRSVCKAKCQQLVPVGDYEIRVRFTKDENKNVKSLYNCVMKGLKSPDDPKYFGDDKKKRNVPISRSIAVYTERDLETLLKLLYEHDESKKIAKSAENYLLRDLKDKIADLRKDDEEPIQTVRRVKEEAAMNANDIEEQIENMRKSKRFGPQ